MKAVVEFTSKNPANYRRRLEAQAKWLLILDEIEAIADKGLPFPVQKKIENGVKVRQRIFPEKGMRWLITEGHLRVLHLSSLGMQVEVVRSGKRTAGPDVLAARQCRRRAIMHKTTQNELLMSLVPKFKYEDDPAALAGRNGFVMVFGINMHAKLVRAEELA